MNAIKRCFACYQEIVEGYYHPNCSKALFASIDPPILDSTIQEIELLANHFISIGSSVTGVQRKLSLSIEGTSPRRFTFSGGKGGAYIFKTQSPDYEQLPENEDLIMHLAALCGIKTALHGLLPLKDGTLLYLTKRFDRKGLSKIAVEDLCQLSELLTEQKYRSSYEQAAKMVRKYSSASGDEVLRFFEVIVFSFIVGNNDMHLKNFSLITEKGDEIKLSPAYDLLSVRLLLSEKDDPEELALSLNGKKRKLKLQDFANFAANLKIPQKTFSSVIKKQLEALPSMIGMIERSFLKPELRERLKEIILENGAKLSAV